MQALTIKCIINSSVVITELMLIINIAIIKMVTRGGNIAGFLHKIVIILTVLNFIWDRWIINFEQEAIKQTNFELVVVTIINTIMQLPLLINFGYFGAALFIYLD